MASALVIIGRSSLALLAFVVLHLMCTVPMGHTQTSQEVLKITIIPHRSHLGNERAYGSLIEALEKETGIVIEWVGSKTYAEVITKLRTGQADIGYVGPFAYVEAHDDFGVRMLARTIAEDGMEFYHSLIITRVDSGISALEDLKGKRFAFTDPKSTSGFLFPLVALNKAGITLKDFSKVSYVKRHANSLLAVLHKQVDAGATSSTAKEKVDVDMSQIRILWKSTPIYRGPWVSRKDLPDAQFDKIQAALLNITKWEKAEAVFEELNTKGFVEGQDSDYDNVREVLKLKQQMEKEQQ